MQQGKKQVLIIWDSRDEESRGLVRVVQQRINESDRGIWAVARSLGTEEHNTKQEVIGQIWSTIIVIGENQILLKVFTQFDGRDSPPIISIANGCEPILYNYSHCHLEAILELLIPEMEERNYQLQRCMKLRVDGGREATCQIQINRGVLEGILRMKIYLVEKCTGNAIEIAKYAGDGLLIATPMGSLCKSMALNGPLMHKEMESILIIPVCPLSMNFRPLCLPATSRLVLEIDAESRAKGQLWIDGQFQQTLAPAVRINVEMSAYRTNMVAGIVQSYDSTFIKGLKTILFWGDTYVRGQK